MPEPGLPSRFNLAVQASLPPFPPLPPDEPIRPWWRSAGRIALVYLLFASTWIYGTDDLVERYVPTAQQAAWQTGKGLAFIALSALLMFLMVGRALRLRVHAARAAQTLKERLELAIRGSTDGVWDWDITDDSHFWTARVEQMLGFDEGEMNRLALKWSERLHPDDREGAFAKLRSHLERDTPYDLEYRLELKDGTHRWFRSRGKAIRDDSGRPTRMAGTLTDIHERVSATERLRESEERYRQTFHTNQAVKLVIDPDTGVIVEANDAACAFYGYSREELLDKLIWEINTLPREVLSRKLELAKSERAFYEFRHRLASGEFRDVEVYAGPFSLQGRRLILSIVHDVTEVRRAREQIARSEAKYRRIVETAQEGIWLVDADWKTSFVNTRMAEMLGYAPEEMTGRHVFDFIHPTHHAGFERRIEARRRGVSEQYDMLFRRKDGTELWVLLSANPVLDDSGAFMGSLAMVTDITHKKEVEQELRRERRVFLAGPAVAWRWRNEPGWPVTYVSENVSFYGYAPADFTSGRIRFADIVHPDDLERIAAEVAEHARLGTIAFRQEYRLRTRDGGWIWLSDYSVTEPGPDGSIVAFAGYTIDDSERHVQETLRDNQRDVLERIAAGAPVPEVLGAVVRLVEARYPECFCSILLLRPDQTVTTAAAPRLPPEFSATIEGAKIGPKVGSCGTAMYHKRRVVVSDIELHPLWDGIRHHALRHGLRACWSEPMIDSRGEVLGSLAIYHTSVRSPDAAELDLIDNAAHLASIAVERARDAAALEQSEKRLRLALAAGKMGVFEWDMASGEITWSEEHARLWGMTLDEFDGTYAGFARRVHPEDLAGVQAAASAAAANGADYLHEYRLVMPDKTVRWIEGRAQFHRDAAGRPTRMVGLVIDITERKAAEDAIRTSEAHNRALLMAIPDLIFRMDREGRYLDYHAPDDAPLMVQPGDFLGRTAFEVLPRRYAEQCMEHLDKLFQTGTPQAYEYDVDRGGMGRRNSWEVRMVLSRPNEAMLLVRNITQAREAQRRLVESEQRMSILVRSTPLGVVIWNTDFTVAEWNPGAERVFGYSAREAIGRHARFIIPSVAHKDVDEVWRRLISNTGGLRSTNQNVRADGGVIWCEWYNSPMVGPDGKVFGVASLVEDITERRLAEQRQNLMMAELDHRVKNNLAAVISLAEQTGRTTATFEEFITTFTGRVRAMSRMHSALARSRWQGADLLMLVTQTLEAFGSGSAGRTEVIGPSTLLTARAAQSMAMALNELATNAVKYGALSTVGGGVRVRWSATSASADPAQPQVLSLEWVEHDGPPAQKPTRRGFGTELIEGAIAYELRGTVEMDFRPTGLVCSMTVPLYPDDAAPGNRQLPRLPETV